MGQTQLHNLKGQNFDGCQRRICTVTSFRRVLQSITFKGMRLTSAISHGTWSSLFASISRHSGKRKKPRRGRLHAHDAIVNTNLALPVELLYPILAEAFGDYLYRLLATPEDLDDINPFLACLHVNSTFRACTLKLMGYLWGNYDMLFDQHSG